MTTLHYLWYSNRCFMHIATINKVEILFITVLKSRIYFAFFWIALSPYTHVCDHSDPVSQARSVLIGKPPRRPCWSCLRPAWPAPAESSSVFGRQDAQLELEYPCRLTLDPFLEVSKRFLPVLVFQTFFSNEHVRKPAISWTRPRKSSEGAKTASP